MLKTAGTEAGSVQRERGRGKAERAGRRGGQYRGMGGGADRREMRWREQLIHCIQLRLQYSLA